jgi:formate dehydrogenase subunit delta
MQPEKLVMMANQIAKFFAVQGRERAIKGIADHVKKFWEPRMKADIFAYIDAGGKDLHPFALDALKELRAEYAKPATAAPAVGSATKEKNGQRGKATA